MSRDVLALDIGGTKLAAGLVDAGGGVSAFREVPTPASAEGSGEAVFAAVEGLLRGVLAAGGQQGVAGIGAGCGGPMTRMAVSPLNIPGWRGFPLAARLEEAFGARAVVDNDAKAMALGEGWLGAARGETCYLGMVVSTGVGGGIVLDGRLLHGRNSNAGHIGHLVVNPGGELCACGGRGCLEAEASGTAIARKAARRAEGHATTMPVPAGPAITAVDVARAARAGDPVAAGVFEEAGAMIGLAIADTANLLDLGLAVVGGGVAGAGDLLFDPCRRAASENARLVYSSDIQVVPAALGRRAGVVGAAALWFAAHP